MTRTAHRRHAEFGFSLIELAVVVLIIGILLTMGLGAMSAVRQNTALSATNTKQAAIKEALIGYLRRNSRLPCPDTDTTAPDGVENRTTLGDPTTACSGRFGILPYVTLGLARDAAQDGWSNFFSYHVSNTTGSNLDWTLTATFRTGNTGTLTVNARNGATVTALSSTIIAVVISHGPNGLGAYTIGGTRNALPSAGTDELDNTNGTADLDYYYRDTTTDDAATGGPFDDVVMYLSADDLFNPLYKDGTLTPPAAAVQAAFQRFRLAIVGYAMGNSPLTGSAGVASNLCTSACTACGSGSKCRVIPYADSGTNGFQNAGTTTGDFPYADFGFTATDGTDPWGVRYRYSVSVNLAATTAGNGISSALPTGTTATAYTITSNGPDRAAGTADDISITGTPSELRGSLVGLIP